MNNEKTHKLLSASNLSDSLNKRKIRKQSKEKPNKTPSLPLNVTEDAQPHHEDYTIHKKVSSLSFKLICSSE